MTEERIQKQIRQNNYLIERTKEAIEIATGSIRQQCSDPNDNSLGYFAVTFLPGMIEDLRREREKLRRLIQENEMLEYLLSEQSAE